MSRKRLNLKHGSRTRQCGWLLKAGVDIIPVDAEQLDAARRGWRRFGKGRHQAALNYGDCFAYALAKTRQEPLLFKGNDFGRTDIVNIDLPSAR
jgi:ribonuclease VapC